MAAPLLILILLPLLLIGLRLIKTGLWPRRQGDTPHCRACGYNVTGLVGERCPECGGALGPRRIVFGERQRSPGRTVGGIACLLPFLMIAGLVVAHIDWYRLSPSFLLIADLQSSRPNRSWNELDRRIQAGALSGGSRSKLIELGLKEQAALVPSPIGDELLNQLGTWAMAGQLSEAQAKTFYGQMVTTGIQVRPKVITGDSVPVGMMRRGACPNNLTVELVDGEVLIDGGKIAAGSGGSSFSGRGGRGSSLRGVAYNELGPHKVQLKYTVLIHAGPTTGPVLHRREEMLEADFEVVPVDPQYAIRLKSDPALKQGIQKAIVPQTLHLGEYSKGHLETIYKIDKMPIDVAFEVFIRVGGREYRVGTLTRKRGESTTLHTGGQIKAQPFTQCDLILRSSEKVARETLDMQEIWDGELIYENLPVSLGPHAATQPQP